MRIGDAGGNRFGNSPSHHELQEVSGSLCVRVPLISLLQLQLKYIQNKKRTKNRI